MKKYLLFAVLFAALTSCNKEEMKAFPLKLCAPLSGKTVTALPTKPNISTARAEEVDTLMYGRWKLRSHIDGFGTQHGNSEPGWDDDWIEITPDGGTISQGPNWQIPWKAQTINFYWWPEYADQFNGDVSNVINFGGDAVHVRVINFPSIHELRLNRGAGEDPDDPLPLSYVWFQ